MKPPAERQDSQLMRAMFTTIAPRYDFITRALSFGMDIRWKKRAVRRVPLRENALVLDLACGTGDFSKLVAQRLPKARVISVDLTEQMLQLARRGGVLQTVCGDASSLPFADDLFDCVFIGYGLQNFPDLREALIEIERVTQAGGLMVSLDFFLPRQHALRQFYLACLYVQGAFWGLLLHGRPRAYTYISDSLRNFISMDDFTSLLKQMGYGKVDAQASLLGGIGTHWAVLSHYSENTPDESSSKSISV